ncbi:methylated-DNA--protein-cysteine methyltransferase, constitutive [mine drainage metagenome]|uniref:methylated-DNA--[protein]-cysteine S-methyltransferase n=1 Tax=mine drainage metagenome TaxID=410659 RepID=A0A1J5RXU7_9ZZZZ
MPYLTVPSPLGDLTLFEENGQLVALDWGAVDGESETPLLQAAARQLDAYFDGRLRQFDLPLAPAGTTFQKRVWSAMQAIPYGQVLRYADVARMLNSGPRAVGGACGRNPLPILIPCHRIVGSNGGLGGYSGQDGIESKRFLLNLEQGEPS